MKRVATTLAVIAASGLWLSDALSEEGKGPDPIGAIAENPYARAVLQILDRWNSGELVLDKKVAEADFDARFRKYSELAGENGFVVERWLPVNGILEQWKELPETLKPELDLSPGAKLMIAATVLDKAEQLKPVAPPDSDALQNALAGSLYITLGAAQKEAQERGQKDIDATAVQRGGVRLFSLGWPFCCATEGP
jgi:hypothetical protein